MWFLIVQVLFDVCFFVWWNFQDQWLLDCAGRDVFMLWRVHPSRALPDFSTNNRIKDG
jgi:hypothetical protein